MHFEVVQSISINGTPGKPNDDRLGATSCLAWVVDGATDLGEPGLLGPIGGAAWLAGTASQGFATSDARDVAETCAAVFHHIEHRFEAERAREVAAPWEVPKAAFAVVQLTETTAEFAWSADCCILLGSGDTARWGTTAPDSSAEAADAQAVGAGSGPLTGAVLTDRRDHRSDPEHFALSPSPEASAKATRYGAADARAGDDLILMSDGFSSLIADYGRYDGGSLLTAIREKGLAQLARDIREIERGDPACVRYPRFKVSDDATALWLRIA